MRDMDGLVNDRLMRNYRGQEAVRPDGIKMKDAVYICYRTLDPLFISEGPMICAGDHSTGYGDRTTDHHPANRRE